MVSSVGKGTSPVLSPGPSIQQTSVSGDAPVSADAAQGNATQPAQPAAVQPGVQVNISPEGAAAAQTDAGATSQNASDADTPGETTATETTAAPAHNTPVESDAVSPVKAFAYGALGLERPDQPHDERNAFYTAGKWLAAGITIGGLISLLA
jgi:hypothetical protein